MTVEFKTVARPEVTRAKKENPYAETVKGLADDRESTIATTLPYNTDEQIGAVKTLISQFQSAGRDAGVTIRKLIEETEKERNGKTVKTVTITLWAVDLIKRPRTGEPESVEVESDPVAVDAPNA